ncbi:hypothetical protein GBF35_02885 [Nonomuraea phyllanthi]|uniref:hypothetical protein n=1 Tax=Nonomuraea phyllanthi TaxID=2219224 RepID=UPI001292ECEC|nr:hypothetical protein [Nonomuraea phyllanthi]QFY05758.1 hypothetical protein GBF35_02885 [Nonomuraea phyllanthi]
MNQLVPLAGATADSRRPQTVLTSDGRTLTVLDNALGHSVRVTAAGLYRYRCDFNGSSVQGVAVLDEDGLVLVDLPGDWNDPDLELFAREAGIPLMDARSHPAARVRAALAGRAPGWQRLRGLPRPTPAAWRKPVAICAGVVGIGLMIYLASTGMWFAWRGLSSIGRLLLDVVEAKWLMVAFSPALLVIRPILARVQRGRIRKGAVLGASGGPYLGLDSMGRLRIFHGNDTIATLHTEESRGGESRGGASSLLLYRYEDLTGLVILDRAGRPLHHLPGRWPPEDAHRFAQRHNLGLGVHRVSREEYLTLTETAKDATP